MEVCGQVLARDNEVTIQWVPAHSRVLGNEKADEFAKAAAGRAAPYNNDSVPDELRQEVSLLHMARSATEARSRALRQSGSPTTSAFAGTGPLQGEASAASICAAHERSWPEGTTNSFLAMQRLGRTIGTRYKRSTRMSAGGATPTNVSPDSTS